MPGAQRCRSFVHWPSALTALHPSGPDAADLAHRQARDKDRAWAWSGEAARQLRERLGRIGACSWYISHHRPLCAQALDIPQVMLRTSQTEAVTALAISFVPAHCFHRCSRSPRALAREGRVHRSLTSLALQFLHIEIVAWRRSWTACACAFPPQLSARDDSPLSAASTSVAHAGRWARAHARAIAIAQLRDRRALQMFPSST